LQLLFAVAVEAPSMLGDAVAVPLLLLPGR
jgi:hypothetical protein